VSEPKKVAPISRVSKVKIKLAMFNAKTMKTIAGINHFPEAFAGKPCVFVSSSFPSEFFNSFHAAEYFIADLAITSVVNRFEFNLAK
jgi:hypothetical protein